MTTTAPGHKTWLALAALVACACNENSSRSSAMSDETREANKGNINKLFEACFNQGDLGLLDALVAPDYVGPQGVKGPAGFRGVVAGLQAAFPDIHYTIDEVVAENDRVAVRWHWTGTHKAPFRTYPATGKTMSNTGTGIFRFKNGKIVSAALETDRLGFLQQVGAVPESVAPVPRPSAQPAAGAPGSAGG
jgi:steroid delta-isomerase-like uncharacterized protein